MENSEALLALLHSSNLLLSTIKVFNIPVKIPQWNLPSEHRTQRVLFPQCLPAQCLNAHLAEYLLTEHPIVLFSFCSLIRLLNALLVEPSKSLVILSSSVNLQQGSSSVHSLHWINALLSELHRTPQSFCLKLSISYTTLSLEVFNKLIGIHGVVDSSSCATTRLCLNPQYSEVLQCTGIQRPQYSVMPSWHETSNTFP
jgi:hypothetical protein